MSRIVVNVATGSHYQTGQSRLVDRLRGIGEEFVMFGQLTPGWPTHEEIPYGFKAFALKSASNRARQLLWADACIIPTGPLDRIWDYAKEHGAWFSKNGWSNAEWCADSAYPDLFPEMTSLDAARVINVTIPHVVATAFALDLDHPKGKAFLDEYYRLASETKAFCGPWINAQAVNDSIPVESSRVYPCGSPDVRGHRHDQTAASVIAWRLGIPLTSPPDMFAYKGGETADTVLIADGNYA